MYNLTVDTAHTFFVGDGRWLVHNTNCLFNADGSPNLKGYDAKTIEALKEPLLKPYGGNRCVECANTVAPILENLGYDVEIVRVKYQVPASMENRAVMRANDGTGQFKDVSHQNYHEATVITSPSGERFYLDQVVYANNRDLVAVPMETYRQYWEYGSELVTGPRQ